MPISGDGRAAFEPVWAPDVARATAAAIDAEPGRLEFAGPERLTYNQIARLISASTGRPRPLLHVPLPFVRSGLIWLRRMLGPRAFATWEEAELMEVAMVAENGAADMRALGVEPAPMSTAIAAPSERSLP
jgi:NADH dehydrogenase